VGFSFSAAAFFDSLLDGVIIGGILAIILVALRGPLTLLSPEPEKPVKHKRKRAKIEQAPAPPAKRKAGLGDYLSAWAMLAVVTASASYAVATGHGACGLIHSAVKGFQAVSDPLRLALVALLDVLTFGALGAALWSAIWWIAIRLTRLLRRQWAERIKMIHGVIFGLIVGGLMGFSACFSEAMAGKIVGPLELLRSSQRPPAYAVGCMIPEEWNAGYLS